MSIPGHGPLYGCALHFSTGGTTRRALHFSTGVHRPASRPAEGYRNLEKPQDVRVDKEGGVPVLKWKPVEGATRYEILRSDNDKGPQGFADRPPWLDDQPADSPVTYRVRGRTDTVTGPESDSVMFGSPD